MHTKHLAPPLLLALVIGCSTDAKSPAPPSEPVTTPAPTPEPIPPTPAPVEVPAVGMETRPLAEQPGVTLTRAAPKTQQILKGGYFTLSDANVEIAVIGKAKGPDTRAESWFSLDMKALTRSDPFTSIRRVTLDATLMVAPAKTSPSLVNLADGTTTTPNITLPGGRKVAKFGIHPGAPTFIIARADDDEVFIGPWRDPRKPDVTLDVRVPFKPQRTLHAPDGEAALLVRNGGGVPPHAVEENQPCAALRVPLDGSPQTCLGYGKASMGYPEIFRLDGGWRFWSGGMKNRPQVYREDGDTTTELNIEGCKAMHFASLATPPRVLVGCATSPERGLTMLLWSPERSWTWREPFNPARKAHHIIGAIKNPVLDGVEWDINRKRVARWFDLQRSVIWSSPDLTPMGYRDHHTQALALSHPEGDPVLVQLDFAAGTRRPLMPIKDCAGQLSEATRQGNTIVLTCRSQPDPDLFVFIHRWTLVINLDTLAYWRTNLYPEALLTDGSLLVSKRNRAAAESVSTFTALKRVTF